MIPKRLNGAKEDKFFNKHKGKSTTDVIPNSVFERVKFNPILAKRALKVSARIIEYATVAHVVLKVQLAAATMLVSLFIDFSHASL